MLLLGITLALASSAPAEAQTILLTVADFNGRGTPPTFDPVMGRPLNAAECTGNELMTFTLANIMTPSGVFAIWRGANVSAACETAAGRMGTGGAPPPCTQVGSAVSVNSTTPLDIQIGVGDLFGTAQCSGVARSEQTFWFLRLTSAGDTTTAVPPADYARLTIILDSSAPSPPTLTGSFAGADPISIDVDAPAGDTLRSASVYVDTAGTGCPTAPASTTLIPGSAPSGAAAATNDGFTVSATAASLGLTADGEYSVVAATVTDTAGNVSTLSGLACVQRVQVAGFWDRYCADRGLTVDECRTQYAGCAVDRSGRPAYPTVILFGLVCLGLVVRRRR